MINTILTNIYTTFKLREAITAVAFDQNFSSQGYVILKDRGIHPIQVKHSHENHRASVSDKTHFT